MGSNVPKQNKKKIQLSTNQKIIGGVILAAVMALFIFWPVIFGDRADRQILDGNPVPALNKMIQEKAPSPTQETAKNSCLKPDKGLLKEIESRTKTLEYKAEQLRTLSGEVGAQRAALEAADPEITTPAKLNALRGAYEHKLGRYERFQAQYDAEKRTLTEKVGRYNSLVSDYNACTGAKTP